jgi:hypothetical protein
MVLERPSSTYCRYKSDIAITVKRQRVDKYDGEGCEIIRFEPFGTRYCEVGWYSILFLH